MQITNRTQKIYTWAAWGPADTLYWGTMKDGCEWIHPGQTHPLAVDSGFQIYFEPGKYNAAQMGKFGRTAKHVENKHAIILIQGDFYIKGSYVDWDAVEKQYIQGKDLTPVAKTSLAQGAAIASSSLKAVSEFIKLIPIAGTAISGLLGIVTNVLDVASKAHASSQQDQQAMLSAIREIVHSENDRQTAESAASTFINADTYLNSLDPNDFGPHELKDLRDNTEDFCAPGRLPMNALTTMNMDADKAKYITSAYLMGISAYVRFLWFHFLFAIADGDDIKPGKLRAISANLQPCLDGVKKLRSNVQSSVQAIITSTTVSVEPELSQLSKALHMSQIGLPDQSDLDSVINDLKTAIQLLAEDAALLDSGKPMQHYFKSNWRLTS
ncbi:hypothetical protein ACN2CC_32045 [Mesorhizobium muleiense]|uniref:hypothetical protein n=1 Tax=Mesorhizobium muleiense TaxID=1004279 RepID=UPI003AFB58E3